MICNGEPLETEYRFGVDGLFEQDLSLLILTEYYHPCEMRILEPLFPFFSPCPTYTQLKYEVEWFPILDKIAVWCEPSAASEPDEAYWALSSQLQ